MNEIYLIVPILLPILSGALALLLNFQKRSSREWYTAGTMILNSAIVFAMIAVRPQGTLTILQLTPSVSLALRLDGLSMVFAGLLAGLWPLATIYGFEYMRHEGKENFFFAFYTMTYGVAVGVAFAANLLTMYLFYELLTLVTLPIIMHSMNAKAIHAGRKYLLYSMTGAAFAFLAIMVILHFAGTTDFVYTGVLLKSGSFTDSEVLIIQAAYLAAFFGFGVKAAIWPTHGWLPTAGVAPTPVTALLHAVAVVKAGVFAVMRVTWYSFGVDLIKDTWVQAVVIIFVCVTIVYGSGMAVKEQHLKRRMAYSTVSNLSYILLGVVLMTPEGLGAGLSHMIFHGIMKICLFFGAGAVITRAEKEYIYEMKGFGFRMPVVFGCFCVGSLAVIGIPGLCGFVSKWNLCMAALHLNSEKMQPLAMLGVAALLISAVLTAIYLFTVIITAFFPGRSFDMKQIEEVSDPGLYMKVPMILLCVAMVVLGLFCGPLVNFFMQVGAGLI